MAALQQTTIIFRSQSPPTTTTATTPSPKLTLSSRGLKLPKLSITTLRRRKSTGSSGATMAASAAGSYASALADVAKANNTLEETQADIEKIEELFSNSEVYNFFNNPTVPIDTKRTFIADLAKESDLKPHVANFLNILIDMKRVELIKEIVKEFEVVYNKLTNTEVAVVTSVVKLESEHLAQIAKGVQKLTGAKNVRIKTVIDASLVAGFTIRGMSTPSGALVEVYAMKMLYDKDTRKNTKSFRDESVAKREEWSGASAYKQGKISTESGGCFTAIFKWARRGRDVSPSPGRDRTSLDSQF